MKQRGRVSAEVYQISGARAELTRPEPPEELNPEERVEWTAIVHRLPADWFPAETHGLLIAYCRHRTAQRLFAIERDKVAAKKPLNWKEYGRICALIDRETRSITALSTKMRLAQQSTYDKSRRKPSNAPTPWDEES